MPVGTREMLPTQSRLLLSILQLRSRLDLSQLSWAFASITSRLKRSFNSVLYYTNATGPSWPMLRETPKNDTPDQYPPRRRHTSQKAEVPPPIHLLAVVAANDDVIIIRVELLTIYLVEKIVSSVAPLTPAGAAQAFVVAFLHNVFHITSQVPAFWRNAVVVVVTQPDCVAVLARNAGTATGANSAAIVETFQVSILTLIKLTWLVRKKDEEVVDKLIIYLGTVVGRKAATATADVADNVSLK